jgi:hypothetical protein
MEDARNACREAWQHVRAAGDEVRKSVASMMPPEVGQHRRAAQKEMLLAFRTLIDAAIERVERKESASAPAAGQ